MFIKYKRIFKISNNTNLCLNTMNKVLDFHMENLKVSNFKVKFLDYK